MVRSFVELQLASVSFGPAFLAVAGRVLRRMEHQRRDWRAGRRPPFFDLPLRPPDEFVSAVDRAEQQREKRQSRRLRREPADRTLQHATSFRKPPAFTFGTVSRTLPDVRAPGHVNFTFP